MRLERTATNMKKRMRLFGLLLLLLQFHHLNATSHPHHNLQSSGNGAKHHFGYKGSDINKLPTKLEGGRLAVVVRRGGGGGGGSHGGGGHAAGHGSSRSNGGYGSSTKTPGSRGTAAVIPIYAAGGLNSHHVVQNHHQGRNGGGSLVCIVPFTLVSTILTLVILMFST